MLSTFGTDDIGDTPSPPLFVNATPSAEKNRLIIKSMYLFAVSFFDTKSRPFDTVYHTFPFVSTFLQVKFTINISLIFNMMCKVPKIKKPLDLP